MSGHRRGAAQQSLGEFGEMNIAVAAPVVVEGATVLLAILWKSPPPQVTPVTACCWRALCALGTCMTCPCPLPGREAQRAMTLLAAFWITTVVQHARGGTKTPRARSLDVAHPGSLAAHPPKVGDGGSDGQGAMAAQVDPAEPSSSFWKNWP